MKTPVPSNTTIRNVDFHPTNPDEVVVSGYSNVVTFVDPSTGSDLCDVTLNNSPTQALTRVEARYRPDGSEVWASSYDGRQIAVIVPPSAPPPALPCTVKQFITVGFGTYDSLYGGSFHPDPTAEVYYVVSYTGGHGSDQIFAVDTKTYPYTISSTFTLFGAAAGMTAVTRGPTMYLLEVPLYGCFPQFGYTNTYDVSDSTKAHNFGKSLIGKHASAVNMRYVATLRNVNR
jgi:hypothetical protein